MHYTLSASQAHACSSCRAIDILHHIRRLNSAIAVSLQFKKADRVIAMTPGSSMTQEGGSFHMLNRQFTQFGAGSVSIWLQPKHYGNIELAVRNHEKRLCAVLMTKIVHCVSAQ